RRRNHFMSVYAIIPAYNEVRTIRDIAAAARSYVDNVVVVDDGSSDGTTAALEGLEDVTVLHHARNSGKAAALLSGFQHALEHGAEAVVTLDGDGQHQPADLPRLLAEHRRHPSALIIAARTRKRTCTPLVRRVANFVADFWISWAAGTLIQDSQSGFRIYPAAFLRPLPPTPSRSDSFTFETALLIQAAHRLVPFAFVDIDAFYFTGQRPSHYRHTDSLRIGAHVARELMRRGMNPSGLPVALRRLRLRPAVSGADHHSVS
ncbi:MAG TPA: glycosyltransferase family 2 protein, partial [Mycobacterium sp.]|nr:glycosyltransferase family 2 protein [Mycobacterium sp.]